MDNVGENSIGDIEILKGIKRVIEYLNLDYHKVLELPCDIFLLAFKNHYIDELMQTEEGQKYLETCERLKETKVDLVGLRKLKEGVK